MLAVLFMLLTAPNGQHIWLAPSQVVAVRSSLPGECYHFATGAVVVTLNGSFCVAEQPRDAVGKLQK